MLKWFWEQDNWISNPHIATDLLEQAQELEKNELALIREAIAANNPEYTIENLCAEVGNSYLIEGIRLNSIYLRSSIIRQLNLDVPEWRSNTTLYNDKEDQAIKVALKAVNNESPMNIGFLLELHGSMENSDNSNRMWGKFRKDPEYVVKGTMDKPQIVFEAPPPKDVPELIERYFEWWHNQRKFIPAHIGAALAHAFFVEIHPFEDGNGRMARILADKALSESLGTNYRPYSTASVIWNHRHQYYHYQSAV